eukprot:5368062-Pleurochrysis_carterae.AAC.5
MMYKWGHPVDTLPSDVWDNRSLLPKNVNFANYSQQIAQIGDPCRFGPPDTQIHYAARYTGSHSVSYYTVKYTKRLVRHNICEAQIYTGIKWQ